jgi:crotonobetainyl-CoA:carnitine CoA-transferase CaiB-like acyl-CoA transferase
MAKMLEGVRVVDFSRVVAGPFCGRVLADLGADVIKVEPPEGDRMPRGGAPFVDGVSAYFAHLNAGKRSVCLDLGSAEGASVAASLVATADAVLENFRPGVLARYGLGPAQLLGAHPRLVYCSVNGYGSDGPWADRRAYAPAVHGEGGLVATVARLWDQPPRPEAVSHADVYAGLMASTAILGALFERERTGRGQHVEVVMADVAVYVNEFSAPELAGQRGPASYAGAASIAVTTADGETCLTVGNPVHTFPQWARAFGHADVLAEERFARTSARYASRPELIELIRGWVAAVPDVDALEAIVGRERLAIGRIRSVPELAETAWATERGVFAEAVPGLRVPRAPFRSSLDPTLGLSGPPPAKGEHNADVLEPLGVDVAELAERGVVTSAPWPDR